MKSKQVLMQKPHKRVEKQEKEYGFLIPERRFTQEILKKVARS